MSKSSIRGIVASCVVLLVAVCLCAPSARAGHASRGRYVPATATGAAAHTVFPAEAHDSLDALYRGDVEAAIVIARRMESFRPESPLGFLLEESRPAS